MQKYLKKEKRGDLFQSCIKWQELKDKKPLTREQIEAKARELYPRLYNGEFEKELEEATKQLRRQVK